MTSNKETPLLRVTELSHYYGDQVGCEEINLEIYNGEVLGIVGESGSGKTTLCSKIASHILDNKFVGNDSNKLSIVNFAPKSSNHSELINFGRLLNLNVTSISTLDEIVAFIDDGAAEPTWLIYLIVPFSRDEFSAVGGFVIG